MTSNNNPIVRIQGSLVLDEALNVLVNRSPQQIIAAMNLTARAAGKCVEVRQCIICVRLVVLNAFCAAEDDDDLLRTVVPEDPTMDIGCGVGDIGNLG